MNSEETSLALASKVTPPITVAGLNWLGFTLPDLVQLASLIWMLLMIVHKVWQMHRDWKKGEDDESST